MGNMGGKATGLLAMGFIAVLFACKKDDENPPPGKSKTAQFISGKTFKLTDLNLTYHSIIGGGGHPYPPCRQDDLHTFEADGKYILADAGARCHPLVENEGTWQLAEKDRKLLIAVNGRTLTYEIITVDESQLVIFLPELWEDVSARFTYQPV